MEKRYLTNDRINENTIRRDAESLPAPIKDFNSFKNQFEIDKNGNTTVKSKNGVEVSFNVAGAFKHFTAVNNTHFDDRILISGAFKSVLTDPLAIVKQSNTGKDLIFYKPFKDENNLYHLAAIKFTNGKFTFFDLQPLSKVKEIIKAPEGNTLYFKYGSRGVLKEEHTTSSKAVLASASESIPKLEQKSQEGTNGLPKGMIDFVNDAGGKKATITFFKSSDVSTAVHETGHYFRRTLDEKELAHAELAFDVKDGHWTPEHEEAFAEGFTKWVSDGKAQTPALQDIFGKMKQWLLDLWDVLKGTKEQNFKLTGDMETLFNAMMGDAKAKAELSSIAEREFKTGERVKAGTEVKHEAAVPSALYQTKADAEKSGVYKVAVLGKKATTIRTYDLDFMNDAIKFERGVEANGKGCGALHIEKHLEDGSVGEVSLAELMSIGKIIRDYDSLEILPDSGKRVYSKTANGETFTVVIGERPNFERTISFYSDRNLQGLTANASLYKNLASSNEIILKFKPKSNISEGLKRVSAIQNEILKSEKQDTTRLCQMGSEDVTSPLGKELFLKTIFKPEELQTSGEHSGSLGQSTARSFGETIAKDAPNSQDGTNGTPKGRIEFVGDAGGKNNDGRKILTFFSDRNIEGWIERGRTTRGQTASPLKL